MFWTIVVIIGILMVILDNEMGSFALILLIAAGALLLIHWILGFAILLPLAKLCAVGIILIVAFSIIGLITGK